MRVYSLATFGNKKNKDKKQRQKIKFNKAKLLRYFLGFAVTAYICFALFFLTDKSLYENNLSQFYQSRADANIIELWHIDSFEGGSLNRADYLQAQAVEYNKLNSGQYITVKPLTIEQAKLNAESGNLPDAVSFGVGAGELFLNRLMPLNIKNEIRDDLIDYGKSNGIQYALPYMLGGYAVISHENLLNKILGGKDFDLQNLYNYNTQSGKKSIAAAGFAKNTLINIAEIQNKNGIKLNNQNGLYGEDLTQYEAYEKFLSGNFVSLIGTQRDVIRCKNREEKGNLNTCLYNYLQGYSDLVQYFGVLNNNDANKIKLAEDFIEYMLSPNIQKTISKTGMFSINERTIYTDGYLKDFEKVLLKPLASVNVFITEAEILNNNQKSLAVLSGV